MKRLKFVILFAYLMLSMGCAVYNNGNEKNKEHQEKFPEWLKINVEEALPKNDFNVWIPTNNFQTSSLIKVPRFPRKIKDSEIEKNPALKNFSISPLADGKTLELSGVKNEQISAQISVASTHDIKNFKVEISDLISSAGNALKSSNILIRYVKYLPVERARSEYDWSPMSEEIIGEEVSGSMNPNFVADALLNEEKINFSAYQAQPVWFTIKIPKNIKPETYKGKIKISADGLNTKEYNLEIKVQDISIPDYTDYKFHLDLWINPTSIAQIYKVEDWSEKHWELIKTYLKDYASAGGKNIATIITEDPWQKPWIKGTTHSQTQYGYKSMVKWIKTKDGKWNFDYEIFDRYVSLAESLGISTFINAYSMTPFHTKQTIKYYDESDDKDKSVIIDITDADYKLMWESFLKNFKNHLLQKGWYDKTYLGFDEKPNDILEKITNIIKNSAPEFLDRLIIAGHPESSHFAQNLSISYMFFPDAPLEKKAAIPVLPTINQRKNDKKTTTFYLCAEPAHPNTLTFSPAVEARMIPWLAYKYNADGYLRWAYNNWTQDIYNHPVFLHTQGDDYYVYPGKNGPDSSIRWELLKEGIEDFELIKMLEEKPNIKQEQVQKAINQATQSEDGRYKNIEDIENARKIIIDNLLKK